MCCDMSVPFSREVATQWPLIKICLTENSTELVIYMQTCERHQRHGNLKLVHVIEREFQGEHPNAFIFGIRNYLEKSF